MGLTVLGLTYAVGRQPVALVQLGHGPAASAVVHAIRGSDGFFLVPTDAARTNTRRIYIARDATSDIKDG